MDSGDLPRSKESRLKLRNPTPTFEEFWSKGIVFYPEDETSKEFVAFEEFRKDPANHPLRTESGKIQIFSPRIASYGYDDCRGYPSYFEPSESLNNKEEVSAGLHVWQKRSQTS